VCAFFIPDFDCLVITNHILRKIEQAGRYFALQAVCWERKVDQCSDSLHFPEKYNKTAVHDYIENSNEQ
jgi:hypothetical protein